MSKCARGKKKKKGKFHPDLPTSTLATAGLSERNVIRCPEIRTYFSKTNIVPTPGQFSKMKNEHKCTICILVGLFKSNL